MSTSVLMMSKGLVSFFVLFVIYVIIAFSSFLNPGPVEALEEKIMEEGDWKASQIQFKDFQYQFGIIGSDASANLRIVSEYDKANNIEAYIEVTHSVFSGWKLKKFKQIKGGDTDAVVHLTAQ